MYWLFQDSSNTSNIVYDIVGVISYAISYTICVIIVYDIVYDVFYIVYDIVTWRTTSLKIIDIVYDVTPFLPIARTISYTMWRTMSYVKRTMSYVKTYDEGKNVRHRRWNTPFLPIVRAMWRTTSYTISYFFGDIVYDVIFPHRYITMSYVDVVRHIYRVRSRTYTPAETDENTVRRRTVISYVILCCLPASAIEATLCSSGPCCHWQRPSPWPAVPMGPASCSSALLNSLY